MNKAKQRALEAVGFRIGDAEKFLALSDEARRLVELRLAVSRAVRRRRQRSGVTQQQLAAKLGSSQSRVAKLESGAADVSLDLLFRGLFALGGEVREVVSRKAGVSAPRVAGKERTHTARRRSA